MLNRNRFPSVAWFGKGIRTGLPLAVAALALLMAGWADSWDSIRRESEQVRSIRARFVQKKHLPILARPFVSEGRFYFQAPGSVRWEYAKPVPSILLVHQGRARRYVRGNDGWVPEAGERLRALVSEQASLETRRDAAVAAAETVKIGVERRRIEE